MASRRDLEALRHASNDYPLQRDVTRLLRELNPTAVLTRRRHELWQRELVGTCETAFRTLDGHVRFKAAAGGAGGGGGGASGSPHRSQHQLPPLRGPVQQERRRTSRGDPATDDTSVARDDDIPNAAFVTLRDRQTRRAARLERAQLRVGLVQSERRLRLCKNGVADPYSAEHRPLWDPSAPRSHSAVDRHMAPSLGGEEQLAEAARGGGARSAALVARPTAQLGQMLPAIPASASETVQWHVEHGRAAGGRSGDGDDDGDGSADQPQVLSPLLVPGNTDDPDGGGGLVSLRDAADEGGDNVTSFFFTQPSFIEAQAQHLRDLESVTAGMQHEAQQQLRSPENAALPLRRKRSSNDAPSPSSALDHHVPVNAGTASRNKRESVARSPQQFSQQLSPPPTTTLRPLHRTGGPAMNASVTLANTNFLSTTLLQGALAAAKPSFPAVQATYALSREYRPRSPPRPAPVAQLSAKIEEHPRFRLNMYQTAEAFHSQSLEKLLRKASEQSAKFDKKYRALDVTGSALPFHATPAAILHHVEDVICRDERQSAQQEIFERARYRLHELRLFLQETTQHPKTLELLDDIDGGISPEHPEPTSDQFFATLKRKVDDREWLFNDIVTAAVLIGSLCGVDDEETIHFVRDRAARLIYDQPTLLAQRLADIERQPPPAAS